MANPFAKSRAFHKLSNVFVSPLFRLLPMPRGFVLLTVTGRRSGKPRRRPVRAIRRDDTLYAVAILGERSDWLRNVRANPEVSAKIGSRTRHGVAREVTDAEERAPAATLYSDTVVGYDYVDYPTVHWSFPTRRKIQGAHREWVQGGAIVAIDLS